MANVFEEIFHHTPAAKPATETAPLPAATKETEVATSPATPAPLVGVALPPTTTVPAAAPKISFVKKIGANFKSVFTWLSQPKVQNAVVAGEALAEAVADAIDPALTGLNPIINNWTQEIFKAESLAAAAGSADGTGEQKAAMVLNALTPQVVQFAEANKMPVPTGDKLLQANTLLFNFLEILGGSDVPATVTTGS